MIGTSSFYLKMYLIKIERNCLIIEQRLNYIKTTYLFCLEKPWSQDTMDSCCYYSNSSMLGFLGDMAHLHPLVEMLELGGMVARPLMVGIRLCIAEGKEGSTNNIDVARKDDVRTQRFSFEVHAYDI
jgi:hypothetical protein